MFFYSCINSKNAIYKSEETKRYTYVNSTGDTIVILPLLTVKKDGIYAILDSIIEFNSKCIHAVMGERTWFSIASEKSNSDTLIIYLTAFQYSDHEASKINERYFGVFYYRDFLFVVSNFNGSLNDFFEQTDSKKRVITSYSNTTYYLIQSCKECYLYPQSTWMSYYYIANQFQLLHKGSTCTEYYPIYHRIRKSDNMEKIALRYGITQNQIMRLNSLIEPILPDKGTIRIQ